MNLRDKLRTQGEEPQGPDAEPASSDWSDLTVEPESPYARIKSVPEAAATAASKAKASASMPKLDVNRRFLVLAGAAAFLTAIMGVMYINNSAAGLSAGGTQIEVVALAADVDRGAKLTEERLTTVKMPKAYLPKGYIAVGEDNEGMKKALDSVAIAPMVEGEPLIEARISAPSKKLGIAYLLKAGERAKTVKVDSASGLAGLIKPGNEVDLIATITDPNNDQRRIGTPVIQKARVIAVGDHLLGEIRTDEEEAKDESGGIESESTVTLAVPGAKINIMTLLEDLGNLKIVLRAEGDTSLQKTAFTDDVIMALVSGRVPPKQVARPIERVVPAYVPPRTVVRTVPAYVPPPVYHQAPPPRYTPPRPRPAAPKPRPVAKPPVHKPANNGGGMPNIIRFGGND